MITTCFDYARGLVTHTGTGDLSVEEIANAFEARLENPDFRRGMHVLWDCRWATISSLSTQDVEQLIKFNSRHVNARGAGDSAIVLSKAVDYGIGRMFEFYACGLPWRTAVFRDLESAIRWLGSPESTRTPKLV
jgi:hypothetical protein